MATLFVPDQGGDDTGMNKGNEQQQQPNKKKKKKVPQMVEWMHALLHISACQLE